MGINDKSHFLICNSIFPSIVDLPEFGILPSITDTGFTNKPFSVKYLICWYSVAKCLKGSSMRVSNFEISTGMSDGLKYCNSFFKRFVEQKTNYLHF